MLFLYRLIKEKLELREAGNSDGSISYPGRTLSSDEEELGSVRDFGHDLQEFDA